MVLLAGDLLCFDSACNVSPCNLLRWLFFINSFLLVRSVVDFGRFGMSYIGVGPIRYTYNDELVS